MKTLKAFLTAALLVGGASSANATVFSGTATFTDVTTGNALNVTAGTNPQNFTTGNLAAGGSQFFNNFMTLNTTDSQGGLGCSFGCTSTDQIALAFSWSSPGSTSSSASGSVSQTNVFVFSFLDGGSLTWAGTKHLDIFRVQFYVEQLVTFANGASAYLDLYDASLSGLGTSQTAQIDMRIRDVKDAAATAVPEPFTLSLFAAGLLGAGALRRRKNRKTAAV